MFAQDSDTVPSRHWPKRATTEISASSDPANCLSAVMPLCLAFMTAVEELAPSSFLGKALHVAGRRVLSAEILGKLVGVGRKGSRVPPFFLHNSAHPAHRHRPAHPAHQYYHPAHPAQRYYHPAHPAHHPVSLLIDIVLPIERVDTILLPILLLSDTIILNIDTIFLPIASLLITLVPASFLCPGLVLKAKLTMPLVRCLGWSVPGQPPYFSSPHVPTSS
ncbi:hypothetical protein A4X13_0g6955 [Tilletia indica]|uniref:Uncharacterized protein n=1 Tax=Tilletia indica TaxID=43049 RepID=A0A177TCC1_9BASI|nr:hypothetical protein A4X13_0g6955 [Tilletia indica]